MFDPKLCGPAVTVETVKKCFQSLCAAAQTDNRTTSMYVSRDIARTVLAEQGVTDHVTELLAECSGEDGRVFTPTLVSLLQAATLGEEKVFALIIVDVQNDFISGSLAVNEGEKVVPVINEMGVNFKHIYKTVDWHPADHISFYPNIKSGLYPTSDKSEIHGADSEMFQTVIVAGPPELPQTLWPVHCVQHSEGSDFHPDLASFPDEVRVEKGMNKMVDSYSGFWDNGDTDHTPLYSWLLDAGVTDVVVCGIAMDYCVGFTALDSARHGFRTIVVEEAVRGVAPTTTEAMIGRCKTAGVEFVSSANIPEIVAAGNDADRVERIMRAKTHFTAVSTR